MKAVILLAAVLTLVPVASAQAGVVPSTLTLAAEGGAEPIVPLKGLGQWTLNVTYCYLAPGALAPTSTEVTLTVADAPDWATLTVSPSTLLVPISPPSEPAAEVCAAPLQAIVYAGVSDAAPLGGSAEVTLVGQAAENAPIAASEGSTTITVKVAKEAPKPAGNATRDPTSNATRNATLPPTLRDQVVNQSSEDDEREAESDEKKGIPALGPALVATGLAAAAAARRKRS